VDKIFLIESVRTHRDSSHKYLFWEHLKWTPRFRHFKDKVVHLVIDETGYADNHPSSSIWTNENNQEAERFKRIMEWNERNEFFNDEDIITFGDTDEISSRYTLHALKYCDPENNKAPIDIFTLFLNKRVFQAYRTANPYYKYASGNSGAPTLFTFAHCKELLAQSKIATRKRGRSGHYMVGGTHTTYYSYVPQLFLKMYSCTECTDKIEWAKPFFENKKPLRDNALYLMHEWGNWDDKEDDIRGKYDDGVEYYPWALKCNPLRYKSFSLFQPDERLYLPEEEVPFTC